MFLFPNLSIKILSYDIKLNSQESDEIPHYHIGLHRLSVFPVKHTIHLKNEAFSVSEKKEK